MANSRSPERSTFSRHRLGNDGFVLLGHDIKLKGDATRYQVVWLNKGGLVTGKFNHPEVYASAVQHDGRVVLAGRVTSLDGIQKHYLARLNRDGTADQVMDLPGSPNRPVTRVAVVAVGIDDNLLIGGPFTRIGDQARSNLDRVFGTTGRSAQAPQLTGPLLVDQSFRVNVATESFYHYTLEAKDDPSSPDWSPKDAVAGDGTEKTLHDREATERRVYRVRVE